jgi:hypothetical protein
MTLFSLDMDSDINCGDVTSNTMGFCDRKAVPVNIDNLFSTTSSDAEDSVSAHGTFIQNHDVSGSSTSVPDELVITHESTMFLDIVDICWSPCCGYSYIILLVNPSSQQGHAAPMKSLQRLDIISSVTALLNGMIKEPLEIMYDWDAQPELLGLVKARFPNIHVVKKEKS